jgi:hypothetical protein
MGGETTCCFGIDTRLTSDELDNNQMYMCHPMTAFFFTYGEFKIML